MNLPTFDQLMETADVYGLRLAHRGHYNSENRTVCAIGLLSFHLDGEAKTLERANVHMFDSCSAVRGDIANTHDIEVGQLEALEYAYENLNYLGEWHRLNPEYFTAWNLGKRLRA